MTKSINSSINSAYQMFLLYGNFNPANILPKSHYAVGTPNLWAAEVISKMAEAHTLHDLNPVTVGPWAVIEFMNSGSYQRTELPKSIASALRGSGRWQVGDNGGQFGPLRKATLEWLKLDSSAQASWELVAKTFRVYTNPTPDEDENLADYVRIERARKQYFRKMQDAEVIATCPSGQIKKNEDDEFFLVPQNNNFWGDKYLMVSLNQVFDLSSLEGLMSVETLSDMSAYLDGTDGHEYEIYLTPEALVDPMKSYNDGPWQFRSIGWNLEAEGDGHIAGDHCSQKTGCPHLGKPELGCCKPVIDDALIEWAKDRVGRAPSWNC
jgi:hypothetical protein